MQLNLFLNTASPIPRITLFNKNEILTDYSGVNITKTEQLLDQIDVILKKNNKNINHIDNLTFVNGPGSFTGLRIGIAFVQIWNYITKNNVYSISNDEFLMKFAHLQADCVIISAGVDILAPKYR